MHLLSQLLLGLVLLQVSVTLNFTVSGFSSGGFMTAQFHVAYSSYIDAVAIFAGGPFYCSQGRQTTAFGACNTQPTLINSKSVLDFAYEQSDAGTIDSLAGLKDDKVWIFSGLKDTVVIQGVVNETLNFYQEFLDPSQIMVNFTSEAAHTWPTDFYGNACTFLGPPAVNNCNYDAAGQFLEFFYGPLVSRGTFNVSNLKTFDQVPYTHGAGMDSVGYVYIPTGCRSSTCRVHVCFHGCLQSVSNIGTEFVANTGLNQWAETNSIVVIYPQAANEQSFNGGGCWDFWGYTGPDFWSLTGKQLSGIWRMAQNVSSIIASAA